MSDVEQREGGGAPLPWVRLTEDVARGGQDDVFVAKESERTAVARELGIVGCGALAARFSVRPRAGGRYDLRGRIEAQVEQACVVTLEPIRQRIEEDIELELWPQEELEGADLTVSGDLEEKDPPEAIIDGRIEIGRIVFETIAAALDPYPRSPDAALERTEAAGALDDAGGKPPNPFAVLADLKPQLKGADTSPGRDKKSNSKPGRKARGSAP